jgi:hypothetical protein
MRRRLSTAGLMAIVLLAGLLQGCLKDKLTKTYQVMYPVYEEKATVLANIKSATPATLGEPGKIYLYGKYIFLNEVNKGVHVIDNENPSNPKNVAFIRIPGNLDIAVKGNTLYADLYTDLLAIDITDPLQAKLGKLVPKVFPERTWTNGFNPDTTKIIVDWIVKDTTVDVDEEQNFWTCRNCMFASMDSRQNAGPAKAAAPGIAGSMSRFAIVNDYMYAVNRSSLITISVANAADPVYQHATPLGWNIETIYPFKDKLFIGSSSGMFIFNLTNPAVPERNGTFSHARACDPVVADDNFAFVTLRTGTFCEGTSNQLDVINVSNVNSPSLVKTYPMSNPFGLAKDGKHLFVCDGSDGLKIYDVSQPNNLAMIKHMKGMETFDVIAWDKRLIVVTSTGLKQYDYSNINNIKLLSSITTK